MTTTHRSHSEAGGGATAGCLLGGEALAPGAAAATLTLSEIAGCGRLEWTGQPSRPCARCARWRWLALQVRPWGRRRRRTSLGCHSQRSVGTPWPMRPPQRNTSAHRARAAHGAHAGHGVAAACPKHRRSRCRPMQPMRSPKRRRGSARRCDAAVAEEDAGLVSVPRFPLWPPNKAGRPPLP